MSRDDRGRLTPGERALWFLQRLAPSGGAYNLAGAVRIADLETAALRRALLRLLERHPALRTTYPAEGGEPFRRVHEKLDPEVVEEALGALDALDALGYREGESALRRRLEAEAVRPFDPAEGPLVRLRIFSRPGGERAVLFVFHHLIADFWSLALMMRELGTLYGEETAGAPPSLQSLPSLPALPEVTATYAEWADHLEAWERETTGPGAERRERLRAFWQERLAGPAPVLALPADRPRPPSPSGAGDTRSLRLGAAATARLLRLGRARGATLFATLLAGYQVLLHRLSGDDEVWIGAPTAGRNAARWAGTVGYFVNPVVLRGRLTGAPAFAALVDSAREEARSALAHRDWPFPLLAEQLQPTRDASWPPLFRAMLTLHRVRSVHPEAHPEEEALALLALGEGGGHTRLGGLTLETLPLRRRAAQLDLALAAAVVSGELRLTLEVDADLFDGTTAERLLGHLASLLTAAGESPEVPVDALPLLSAAERQELLVEWNDTAGLSGEGIEAETSLAALFAAQAARAPAAPALVCGGERWTYAELADAVESLAGHLRERGVKPETRVALCAGRSPRTVVALLGILAAGGAYVPLDPCHPRERLRSLLAGSGAALLVTESALLPLFAGEEGEGRRPVVLLDEEAPPPRETAGERPGPGPHNLAYVLYTSGSTGQPKGVEIEHGSALALVRWAARTFGPEEREGVLAATSFGFDLSVFELFLPLSTGGAVILVESVLHLPAQELLPSSPVHLTLINTVPSAMSELVRLRALPASVRTICLAGERLSAGLAGAVHRFLPGVRLLNLYGPTEATTYSTWAAVSARAEPRIEGGAEPSIGRPIDGTRVQILDRGLRLVPAGAAGELCLAGAGLARGYAGRPDLTAARFVPDSFAGGGPGSRLYRTGDLARWRPDGCLEILGRLDHQVKLRGFRIEPGEVEAVLAADPAVREAAVLARGDADRRLVAYVAGVPWLDPASLRDHLAARLPAALVPSVFVVLDSLPLTPNGKVDRRLLASLPLPEVAEPPRVPPRDPVEKALAAIWGDVLGREPIGAGDDFFALGGHSLLATRVAARVRDLFTVELPLRDFFEASTLAALAERLRAARRVSVPPLQREPAASGGLAPLSFAQERLWLVDRLAPGSPAYHLAGAARLRGPLRPADLQQALDEIVARHEVLRTRYADGPAALTDPAMAPERSLHLPCIDLTGLAEVARESAADHLAAAAARMPFDLENGPVLRVLLVRLGAAEHDLLLVIHHIAADGASIDLFFRELAALYGRPGSLPPLPVQVADFARWQRAWLTAETLAPHLAWWEMELAGAPAALGLAADRAAGGKGGVMAGGTAGGICLRHLVPPAELGDLRRRCGATSFMVMTAAFLALLGRLTGQGDILLGMPVSERGRRELEPLLGCLINTLVLRGRMADDPSFEELLRRTRAACLDAWSHQDLPFERLVERRREIGELAALLEVHPERAVSVALGEATLTLREVETGAAKLDLALTVEEAGPELRAALRYRRGLFDAATAEHVLAGLEALLAAVSAEPAARLGDLPLLGEAERRQVLEWGEGPPPAPGLSLLSLIAGRAAEAPDAPAVLFAGRVVRTRSGLLRRAVRLADELAELGAGLGTVVGLCLDRSLELVEAVLGVLVTGASYLPLDPAYPRAYLEHVLEDSAVPLVLTRAALRDDLPATRGRVVVLSGEAVRDLDPLLPFPALLRRFAGVQESPAYLLYTSGSTGLPKGVPVTHRSLDAYLAWVMEGPLSGIDGLPFVTSLSFDASLKQLFGPLLGGFPIRLVDEETAHRPESLLAELRGPGRLALNCVPSVWRAVLDAFESRRDEGTAEPLALVRLLLGGEGFDRGLLEQTWRLFPGLEVWNLYGPTEATANAAAARLEPGEAITIGRPIRGARLHVVDAHLAPLPPGIAGELVLGGAGVAPGYWRRPALTAARFVPDPFSGEPGARLYRTGDRARFRALSSSGAAAAAEILGRIDRQLKVRGLRIEPEEIEAALQATPGTPGTPGIAECAVGIDPLGDRLIAWIVPRRGAGGESAWGAGEAAALRRRLEDSLPAAMVPAAFLVLEALPRTPAGKVDHAALAAALPAVFTLLPAPGSAASDPALPRTPAEEVLAGIWAEVLGVAQVDIHDDFFACGGHSLLAARLLSRVRNAFGVDLPLRSLFTAPTVAGLAAAVTAARRDLRPGAVAAVPPVSPAPRDERLLLSFAQERLWFLDQWMPDSPAYNIPAAVRLDDSADDSLDVGALAAALAEIVRRHEALRGTFSAIAGLPVQILQESVATPLPVIDLAGLDAARGEAAAVELAGEEARRPFDLRCGPLLRLRLLRLGGGRHTLLLNLHHIVADGWSMGVLISELHVLYPAFRAPREGSNPRPARPLLPPLPVQYPDFAAWQRRRAESGAFVGDLAWWRGFLAGAPAGIDLPTDRPRPTWSIHRGALAPFALSPSLTAPLRALARRSGATLFMTLLAAFQALLARLSGAEDLVVGTAVDQRTPEVEGLIGLFVNLLALRGDLTGDPRFSEILGRARRVTLDAHDHRDLPFERLVAEIEPVRHPGRNPIFQAAFSLQSAPRPEPSLPGLSLAVRELDTGTARFDLTLLLRETVGGVRGSLEHSADLFDAATVGRLLSGLEVLLNEIVTDPDLPLSRLPLLASAERWQILEEWGKGRDQRPRREGLGELFARQAERTPGAVAVSAGGVETTYGELARRASLLALHLRELGVGPDVPVALCLERSLEMLVGIVAIVQAGGAYVPLDLGYPRERLSWMLEDSGARIVVARGAGLTALGGGAGLRTVDPDQAPAPESRSPAAFPCDLDNLAYILYTSGSTGRPKGVAATHRGVVRVVVDPGYVDLGPEETLLQLAPIPFDASTLEIWGALVNGGRLAVYPPGPVALRELGETLRRERITTLFLTTGLFHQMVDEELASLAGLRQLVVGGDVMSVVRARRVLEALPALRLINGYGPTEATTFAICHTATVADAARPSLTLGRPIARTSVHILDGRLEPVPPGVPGELWLGGDGLARGYHGRPEMTALRFAPSPFPETGGERLYRTGDLARWLPDGTVDFLGRIDRQVKIRGFRVEPAEVEATLESHPGIAACVVLPRGEAEDKRLVAWVVPALSDTALSETELLAWCRERLPPFLIPAAFVRIGAVPLDLNGKVDRRALPEPDRSRRAAAYVAPRTPVEERVAAVWAEVLGLDQVGAEDDFFLLGGHSLLATQIVSRLSRAFGLELGLREFFEAPSVAGVAVAITREQIRQGDPERMASLLAQVQGLSPEELADLLRESRE